MKTIITRIIVFHLLLATNILGAEFTKEQLDAAARKSGFSDADYPYYSNVNCCGPDGWKNKAVPNKSLYLIGADWSIACNQHDRDYMTIGADRNDADKRMKKAMEKIMQNYLKETVTITVERAINRTVKKVVPVKTTKRVAEKVKKRVKDSWKPWKWHTLWITVHRDVVEITYKEIKEEVTDIVKDTKVVTRASTFSPEHIQLMKAEIEIYYQAIHQLGEPYFNESQKKQQKYTEWLEGYLVKDSN